MGRMAGGCGACGACGGAAAQSIGESIVIRSGNERNLDGRQDIRKISPRFDNDSGFRFHEIVEKAVGNLGGMVSVVARDMDD